MIRAVVFDMDGLLINSEPFWQKTEREVFAGLGIHITESMQKETFGLRTDEQIKYWYNHSPWENPDFSQLEKHYDRIILDFFRSEAELMEGAEYILDFFESKAVKMALASSSSMVLINAFLEKFNLHDVFHVIYSAENENYGKPHPAVYLSTAKMLNVYPSSCLAFEDSFNGLLAAKAAKMKAVAIPDEKHFGDPRYTIADFKLQSLKDFDNEKLYYLNSH